MNDTKTYELSTQVPLKESLAIQTLENVKQPAKKNKKTEEYTTKHNYTLCNYSYIMCNV